MELATRGSRFAAAVVDMVLLLIPNILISVAVGSEPLQLVMALAVLIVVVAQIVLLAKRGQTIGKRMLGIRIVKTETGENGGFITNVLLRGLANGVINVIPGYFLVDSLFIFRQDQRCIHDFIAGTCVVAGNPPA